MNRRKWAKGKPCQIRIPCACNFNPETSVLAHIRLAGITGGGQKAPDYLGAIACSSCHDLVDGRVNTDLWGRHERLVMFYEGVFRTQVLWEKENG